MSGDGKHTWSNLMAWEIEAQEILTVPNSSQAVVQASRVIALIITVREMLKENTQLEREVDQFHN